MMIEEKLQVQTAAERLNFIKEYIKNHKDNYDISIISYYCSVPYRSEKQVSDQIQMICRVGSLNWVKTKVNEQFNQNTQNIIVLIENKDYLEVEEWLDEQGLSMAWLTNNSYSNFSYYKIYYLKETII